MNWLTAGKNEEKLTGKNRDGSLSKDAGVAQW